MRRVAASSIGILGSVRLAIALSLSLATHVLLLATKLLTSSIISTTVHWLLVIVGGLALHGVHLVRSELILIVLLTAVVVRLIGILVVWLLHEL